MHAVRGEPVHALHVDAQPLDHLSRHIVPLELLTLGDCGIANGADETRTPFVLQRKNGEKLVLVEADVHEGLETTLADLLLGPSAAEAGGDPILIGPNLASLDIEPLTTGA